MCVWVSNQNISYCCSCRVVILQTTPGVHTDHCAFSVAGVSTVQCISNTLRGPCDLPQVMPWVTTTTQPAAAMGRGTRGRMRTGRRGCRSWTSGACGQPLGTTPCR